MNDYISVIIENEVLKIDLVDKDILTIKWKIRNFYVIYNYNLVLHRVILERMLGRPLVKGEVCDHINGDTLDNRRCNLRVATHSQNSQNRKLNLNNSTGYRGVVKLSNCNKYRAKIYFNNKLYNLGHYTTAIEAALAYDKAAKELFGEFARLNFS